MQNSSFGSNTNTHKTVINTNSRWNRKTHLRARASLSLSLFSKRTRVRPHPIAFFPTLSLSLSLYITRARAPLFFSLSLSLSTKNGRRASKNTLLLFVCTSRASSSLVTRGLYLGFHKEVFLSLSLSLSFFPSFSFVFVCWSLFFSLAETYI